MSFFDHTIAMIDYGFIGKQKEQKVIIGLVQYFSLMFISILFLRFIELNYLDNFIKYILAYLPNRLFIEKKTGALYESGGMFGTRTILTSLRYYLLGFGPNLHTEDKLALSPGIAGSTFCIESIKEMEQFEYIGKI